MRQLSWKEAIIHVLQDRSEPMHYVEIAQAIAELKLRIKIGATPASTVNATISGSIQNDGENSTFLRVGRGLYALRPSSLRQPPPELPSEEPDAVGLINAFGMYWVRNGVVWQPTKPRILGQQQPGSDLVDFCDQRGVYLLHDGRAVIYVGRASEQPIGVRLKDHVSDRLNGRWDRFSWFGVYPVTESGDIQIASAPTFTIDVLIANMEALLIESLEPPLNRKRGDDLGAAEFLQVRDPELQKAQLAQQIAKVLEGR